MKLPKKVQIKEVGPRDGLQNENQFISTDKKIEWINIHSDSSQQSKNQEQKSRQEYNRLDSPVKPIA